MSPVQSRTRSCRRFFSRGIRIDINHRSDADASSGLIRVSHKRYTDMPTSAAYCERDTLAMVEVHRALIRLSNPSPGYPLQERTE